MSGGGTALLTGSSFASAIVCGIAGLLLSIQRRKGKEANPRAVREALLASAAAFDPGETPADDERNARMFLRNFLDKLCYQLRNLGRSSPDRAPEK